MKNGQLSRTPERREAILRLLRSGNTESDSARFTGIDPDTLTRWKRADAGFRRAVEEAEATATVHMVSIVVDAAFGRPAQYDDVGRMVRAEVLPDADRAQWWLERRRPHDYGRRVTFDVRNTVERYAAESGFDVEEVMAEIDRLYEENAEQYRRS